MKEQVIETLACAASSIVRLKVNFMWWVAEKAPSPPQKKEKNVVVVFDVPPH